MLLPHKYFTSPDGIRAALLEEFLEGREREEEKEQLELEF